MILIAPRSTEYVWYPLMLSVLAAPPLLLPDWSTLLFQESQVLHNKYKLHAWFLSTEASTVRRYRNTLQSQTVQASHYGYVGGKSIQGLPLFS